MKSGRELKVCEFNVENLFISMDYHQGESLEGMREDAWRELALSQFRDRQKPLARVWGLAQTITEIDPDIVMMIEVGGRDSLENLNRHFLGERFDAHFVEGNSRRNIDLGFLVRKGLPFRIDALSNRETPIEVTSFRGKYVSKFSRDVAELRIHDGESVTLILLLTHLKSKISTEEDYLGKDVRTAEAIALSELYKDRRAAHPGVPLIVGGDFNAELGSLELEMIRRTDLVDFHDVLDTPSEDRVSLVHFDYFGRPRPQTLDYLLVSPELVERIVRPKSRTWRYTAFHDVAEPLPSSASQRYQQPSDHYPLVLTVSI